MSTPIHYKTTRTGQIYKLPTSRVRFTTRFIRTNPFIKTTVIDEVEFRDNATFSNGTLPSRNHTAVSPNAMPTDDPRPLSTYEDRRFVSDQISANGSDDSAPHNGTVGDYVDVTELYATTTRLINVDSESAASTSLVGGIHGGADDDIITTTSKPSTPIHRTEVTTLPTNANIPNNYTKHVWSSPVSNSKHPTSEPRPSGL